MKKDNGTKTAKAAAKKNPAKKPAAPRKRTVAAEDVHKYEAARPRAKRPTTRGARPRKGSADIDNLGELPRSHGDARLFVIAQEPHRLFCYWDYLLTENTAETIYLRHRRDGAQPEGETAVPHDANSWYLPVREADADYIVELGHYGNGGWTPLTASRTVSMPRDTVAGPGAPVFANVPSHLSFQNLVEKLRGQMRQGENLTDTLVRLQKSGAMPSEFAGSASGAAFGALLGAGLGSLSSGELARLLSSPGASLFSGAFAPSSWGASSWGGAPGGGPSASFLEAFGASGGASWPGPAGSWSSGAVSSWGAPSSGMSSWRGAPREFFMHVNAEVIFYGGTHPDAKVTIAGQPVALQPDGTFRHHFVLPDGEFEIPVTATSPDGVETRRAVLKFGRATTRHGDVGATAQPPLGEPMGRKK